MAWIERFKVTGLAGRSEPVEHTLDRHVNIFWGLNGAGKTTLLKILHAAMNNDSSALAELPFETAEVVLRVGVEQGYVTRRYSKMLDKVIPSEDAEIYGLDESDSELPWVVHRVKSVPEWTTEWDEADFDSDVLGKRFQHAYLPITRISERRRRTSYSGERRPTGDEVFVEQVRDRWRDYANESLTRIRAIQQQGLATVLATLFGGVPSPVDGGTMSLERVDPKEAYSMVRNFLHEQGLPLSMSRDNFAQRYETSEEHRQVVSEIQEVRHHTDQVLMPQREFQNVIDSMYTGNKHLVLGAARTPRPYAGSGLKVEIGDRQIPLKSLSSGEKQLLQILLEVLGASGDTVMIDEPELSLHVNWQQQLVNSMVRINRGCQLLLATHSPEIMADVNDENVFEL